MDDLPTPTEQHSKFALKMMLDNLTPEQRKAYEANGRFTVHLQGKTYLISRIADNPVPSYDLATIESEIRSLSSNERLSNGFKQALRETIRRWRGEIESLRGEIEARGGGESLTIEKIKQAKIWAQAIKQTGVGVVIPHPFAKRNKP